MKQGFFARLGNLIRGIFGAKLNHAEVRHADVVYQNAITQQRAQADRLKDAVGRLIYHRNRSEAQLRRHEQDFVLVERALVEAARNDRDDEALALIEKKKQLASTIENLREGMGALNAKIETAKKSLKDISQAVEILKRERAHMLARKENALARKQIQEIIGQVGAIPSVARNKALENVRESIARLEASVELEPAHEEGISMSQLRDEARKSDALEELDSLKRSLKPRLIQAKAREPELVSAT